MKYNDTRQNRVIIFVTSFLLTIAYFVFALARPISGINVLDIVYLFFWGIWLFFIIPSYRKFYFCLSNKAQEDGIRLGIILGGMGFVWIFFPILVAPYLGIRYYLGQ